MCFYCKGEMKPSRTTHVVKNMYPSATVNTKPNIVNVSVGDVKLTDVRDVDGFAKAMGRDFVPLARQALARF